MTEYQDVGPLREFPEGKIRRRMVDGHEVGVVFWQGTFYAFNNRCPHADFQMSFGFVEGEKLHCPIHYAEFELATGKAVYGPEGITNIVTYSVRVHNETVQVSLDATTDGSNEA